MSNFLRGGFLKKIDIASLVKPHVRSLRVYNASEIPCRVKLDANESPYGFNALKGVKTNRYPDPEAKTLRKLVAREFKVKYENVLHGNGSDELIYYLITTFGGPVLYPVPTFSMYGIIAQALGEKKIEIPLDGEFDLNAGEFLKIMEQKKPGLIFLSSPNNPTGNCFSQGKIEKIVKGTKGLIVIDEAYNAFSGGGSFVPLLKKHKHLVILKTLSKIGLAGLRVGFMLADSGIIQAVNKVRLPFNLNSISQRVAAEALRKKRQVQKNVKSIISERQRLFQGMENIKGIKPYPSDANFILFKVKDPDKIYRGFIKRGVLVRNMKEILNGCLRVTVGTPRENIIFLKTLKQLV